MSDTSEPRPERLSSDTLGDLTKPPPTEAPDASGDPAAFTGLAGRGGEVIANKPSGRWTGDALLLAVGALLLIGARLGVGQFGYTVAIEVAEFWFAAYAVWLFSIALAVAGVGVGAMTLAACVRRHRPGKGLAVAGAVLSAAALVLNFIV